MAITKTERIEIDLPQDIIFAIKGLEKREEVKKKLKVSLALLLFQERSVSLGKAAELAEMSRARFMEVLKEHGMYAYEYTEVDFERDQKTLAEMVNK